MHKLYIKQISLKNFRNFSDIQLSIGNQSVVVTGHNGSGKTSILEAISLLFPGRGIKGAKFSEMSRNHQHNFYVEYILESKLGLVEVTNDFNILTNKRTVRFNHDSVMPANDLSKLTSIIWFTPQMQSLLVDATKVRRKFLDRIIFNFDNRYANSINKYDHYLYERMKLLRSGQLSTRLLDIYEEQIASNGIDIVKSRQNIINMLQLTLDNIVDSFVNPRLFIRGEIEKDLMELLKNSVVDNNTEEMQDIFIRRLKKNRNVEAMVGKTLYGPHKSDFIIMHGGKSMQGEYCSTGEQKMLLIFLLIAQIDLCINQFSTRPILLLDEIFTSLDQNSKNILINYITKFDLQTWITATDLYGINDIVPHVQHIDLQYAEEKF